MTLNTPLSTYIFCFLMLSMAWGSSAFANGPKIDIKADPAEQELVSIIELIENQKINQAIKQSKALVKKYPKFKLANLVYGDLVASQQGQLKSLGHGATPELKSTRDTLYQEASVRITANSQEEFLLAEKIPQHFYSIGDHIPYLFIIDLSKYRLYLFENKAGEFPKLLASHYVTMGKNGYSKEKQGDERTPLGVYHVTSYLEDNNLPELYGWGAFPIDYPNAWDKRHKRSGNGIWLHGVPRSTYSRPPRDSRGCLAISNDFLQLISSYINVQTPVIISKSIQWISRDTYQQQKMEFEQLIESWRQAWESGNATDYLSFYSKDFNNFSKNYKQWKAHKSRVLKHSKNIQVGLSDVSIFKYPGEENLISVTFKQRYQSSRFKQRLAITKQQYWQLDSQTGEWKIIYEGRKK